LKPEKVAAVPGIAFARMTTFASATATSLANIEKGLDRMDRFVRGLKH